MHIGWQELVNIMAGGPPKAVMTQYCVTRALTDETSQTHQSAVRFCKSGAGTSGSIPNPIHLNSTAQNSV